MTKQSVGFLIACFLGVAGGISLRLAWNHRRQAREKALAPSVISATLLIGAFLVTWWAHRS